MLYVWEFKPIINACILACSFRITPWWEFLVQEQQEVKGKVGLKTGEIYDYNSVGRLKVEGIIFEFPLTSWHYHLKYKNHDAWENQNKFYFLLIKSHF